MATANALLCSGFGALVWCGECRKSVLVAFSCRGRSFCPSCEKKKLLLWAEWLGEQVLADVAHRHLGLTIPRLLRPLFRRRRELLRQDSGNRTRVGGGFSCSGGLEAHMVQDAPAGS